MTETQPPGLPDCPKCGRPRQPEVAACPRCGLVFARWAPEQAAEVVPLDDKGARLWAELREGWNDEALHDSFVKHCSSAGRLPAAGRMYRACLDRDPSDPLAAKMQARIVGMATALLTPTQPPAPAVSRRGWFWWVVLACAMAGVLASLLLRFGGKWIPTFELPPEAIRASLEPLRRPLSIAVLRSHNPFNVGAIIRTAHSFLVRDIVLVGSEPYYERASMGMQRYENIVNLADEAELVSWARGRGLHLAVFEREEARVDLWRAKLPEGCLMVFGSETHGVPAELVSQADEVVAIPMYGINHSFPVTVAAGIAMAEWTRRHYLAHP